MGACNLSKFLAKIEHFKLQNSSSSEIMYTQSSTSTQKQQQS
jgi:hypothetical protein